MTGCALLQDGLDTLCPGYSPQAVDQLMHFSAMLLDKNRVMNLTAVTDPREVITRHFLDCAALAPYVSEAETVLDVGTGAGFPGLPLAVLCPSVSFTLLDAQKKRVEFLREVIASLGLLNVSAVHGRAEEFAAAHREYFDAAVSRAVSALRVLCELALPAVRVGGAMLAMKAAGCEEEVDAAAGACAVLGAPSAELLRYTVPHDDVERVIVRLRKCSQTPARYPRRFKKIQSDPL